MVQVIEQKGSLFGRLGQGFGQGLADQIPKEIERHRLSSGLKDLEKESGNLTPLQQYTRLASIPGITPQMIQTFGELTKNQNLRDAYQKRAGRSNQEMPRGEGRDSFTNLDVNFQGQNPASSSNRASPSMEDNEAFGQPQIQENNPLRQSAIPKAPWTPDRKAQEINRLSEEFPNLPIPEVMEMAADSERRELAQAEGEQAVDQYFKKVQQDFDTEFKNQLQTKLQKVEEGVYKDITGENLQALKRGAERELRSKSNSNDKDKDLATVKDVVNKWTDKALDLAKAKTQLKTLSNENLLHEANPLKSGTTLEKLKTYQKIFADTGNSEEFFNILKSDFHLSPYGAASIAYPRSRKVKEYVSNVKPSYIGNRAQTSRKYAVDIENTLTGNDSLSAIAKDLYDKDPYFSQREFFKQLSEDLDTLPLNPRQKREIAQGAETDYRKSWGDIWILPWR